MDPSLTGLYRVSQKVSDVIPVLRLTPIATQPSAVSVFSVAKCEAKGFLQGGPKVRKKFDFFTISSLYVPYISATAENRGLQAEYVAFRPSLWKPCEIYDP